ncbi:hypothetical protein KLA_17374 [Cellulophaga geojensis KL-A]|uniref:Uncharacterized protein n=1 Tax=Cellulophaga geojensis KL-A TaxID=1328323 RepID=A0ABP3B283_9FLAO|nr:hypothetical protein [Cellulophaga geojensis]EWH09144.1 hypothetical protein KLA_17374 [Cellulophaga geojensis KL-A]
MKKVIFLFLIVISSTQNSFAHQDFWITKEFGNVKTRIKTGYFYEEIQKIEIIGELAKILCEKLNYTEPILLDFNHFYVGQCEPDYFISFDKGIIKYDYGKIEKGIKLLSKNGIVIRQVSNEFDPSTSLALLEYAILNLKTIKSNQKEIEYDENYCQWIINTFDTIKIKEAVKNRLSHSVKEVLANKIYRPESDFKFGYTYYWQDGKFTVIELDVNGKETIVSEFEKLYDFKRVGNCVFIFTSASDFYTINKTYGRRPKIISKKWTITNAEENYRPYKLEYIGGYKYSIYFWYNSNEEGLQPKHRTLIYDESTDELLKL